MWQRTRASDLALSRVGRTRYCCRDRAIAQPARVSRALEQQYIGFSVRSSHAEVVDPAVSGHDDVEPVGIRRGRDVHVADLVADKTVCGALNEDVAAADPERESWRGRHPGPNRRQRARADSSASRRSSRVPWRAVISDVPGNRAHRALHVTTLPSRSSVNRPAGASSMAELRPRTACLDPGSPACSVPSGCRPRPPASAVSSEPS